MGSNPIGHRGPRCGEMGQEKDVENDEGEKKRKKRLERNEVESFGGDRAKEDCRGVSDAGGAKGDGGDPATSGSKRGG